MSAVPPSPRPPRPSAAVASPASRTLSADLLVVGGGPIGLATAVEANLAGLSVVIADPRGTGVDKACGEGLMPPAVAMLRRLGVSPPGHPLRGIRYLAPGQEVGVLFRAGPGRGVRRTALSEALAARADALGVRRLDGRVDVEGLRGGGPGGRRAAVTLAAGGTVTVHAAHVAAADGLHSATRRALGMGPAGSRRAASPRYGQRRHYRLAPWSDLVEVHWSPHCEAYVTPVGPDLVGVAVLGGGGSYDSLLDNFPELRDRLAGAAHASEVRGAGPLRQDVTRRVDGSVLLVGDAAGYVDALTGEGIAVGLLTAQALVAAVVVGRPADYEDEWRRSSRRYRVLTGGLLRSTSVPLLRRALVPTARRAPRVFAGIVDQLA